MQDASLIKILDLSGNSSVTVVGGTLYVASHVIQGQKNMTLHLSVSTENLESRSQVKTCRAALESLSTVALYVGPDAKMLPSLM